MNRKKLGIIILVVAGLMALGELLAVQIALSTWTIDALNQTPDSLMVGVMVTYTLAWFLGGLGGALLLGSALGKERFNKYIEEELKAWLKET